MNDEATHSNADWSKETQNKTDSKFHKRVESTGKEKKSRRKERERGGERDR